MVKKRTFWNYLTYKESVKLLIALAAASKNSADQVYELLNKKEIFAEPIEEVPGHNVDLKGGKTVVNLVSRHKGALILSSCLSGKTKKMKSSVIQVRMDQGLVVTIRCPMRSW